MAPKTRKSAVSAVEASAPAGGGAFAFDHVSIGVFLTDQPDHRIALGSDRRDHKPLEADQGWILPAGIEGICEFDRDHSFIAVQVPAPILAEAGVLEPSAFAARFGALDPLLLQMAKQAARFDGNQPALYRDTMHRALAAHLGQLITLSIPSLARVDDIRLKRAIAYLHDHLADDIGLDDLAAQAAMSPYHFARAFKAATGRSPLQYVIVERIEAAKLLLTTTHLPVAEIAHRVGYGDVSRFGQHFKRATGMTPAVFRAAA